MTARQRLAHILWTLSSVLKNLGHQVVAPDAIVVDSLTLPGWYVMDKCIIHERLWMQGGIKKGFEWLTWPMPEEWCDEMNRLAKKQRKGKSYGSR